MRVLIDTNVYVSALVFGGVPLKAVQSAQAHGRVVAFDYIVKELSATLAAAKFGWPKGKIHSACKKLFANTLMTEPAHVIRIARDAKDDPILACALAAKAEIIVTGDKDLLALKQYKNILILTTTAFIQQMDYL